MRITDLMGTMMTADGGTRLAARAERIRASITEYVAAYNAGIPPGPSVVPSTAGTAAVDGDLARLGITRTADGRLAFDEDAFARGIASGVMRPGDLVTALQAIKSLDAGAGDAGAAVAGVGTRYSGVA